MSAIAKTTKGGDTSTALLAVAAMRDGFESQRNGLRRRIFAHIADFSESRCAPQLEQTSIGVATVVLVQFLYRAKCLRSTFIYLGWLRGDAEQDAALRASAGLEFLYAFALLQDDVMDDSPLRRGLPAAQVQFGQWHREHGLTGSAERFAAAHTILVSDLCPVWADQMMGKVA